MIEYLNHKLIEFIHKSTDSNTIKSTDYTYEYLSYKCIKCNNIIFFTLKNELYWMYENGKFEIPKMYTVSSAKNPGWHFLHLTCEEEQIRKLVE